MSLSYSKIATLPKTFSRMMRATRCLAQFALARCILAKVRCARQVRECLSTPSPCIDICMHDHVERCRVNILDELDKCSTFASCLLRGVRCLKLTASIVPFTSFLIVHFLYTFIKSTYRISSRSTICLLEPPQVARYAI
jgi:hypothetical protein